MKWWKSLPNYWRGFITGGVVVPLSVLVVEFTIKYALYGEFFLK
ncbi:hypothetical protein [uncultured Pseudodesulfovibrio sp.]|nr:hypothetical protein [uncultured Pseudodesulfovibrio sp.]